MKNLIKFAGLLVLALMVGVAILYLRSDLKPQVWEPAPLPELRGVFAPNSHLDNPVAVRFAGSFGPEDVARDASGVFYTGLKDGRIMRFTEDGNSEEVINTGGRVLGLQFDSAGNLIIADALKGLLKLNNEGQLSVLTDAVDDVPMLFTDDLDIAEDGTIWFSDASMRFGYPYVTPDFLEASATGRLLTYSPATGKTEVQMTGLFFANGVALGPDDSFVLINETGTGRIHRLWLKGPDKGKKELFHAGLPGNPDNLSFNGTDTFWVALPAVRDPATEATAKNTFVRRVLGGLPMNILPPHEKVGFVVGIDLEGNVSHCLFRRDGVLQDITSVNEWDNKLFLGSLIMDKVHIVDVPARAQ